MQLKCVTEWRCCHQCFNLHPTLTKAEKRKEFYLPIFGEEKNPVVLLEKQLHKHGVYGVGSYLKTEVENQPNSNNDFFKGTPYKYLNVFMQTYMCLWVCVTKREHFPKSKFSNDEESQELSVLMCKQQVYV